MVVENSGGFESTDWPASLVPPSQPSRNAANCSEKEQRDVEGDAGPEVRAAFLLAICELLI